MKKWNYILATFLSISTLFIQSCNKDDDGSGPINNETNSIDNGNLKNITLYKLEGENIVKQKDFTVAGNALALQKDTQNHQEIWNLTKKLFLYNIDLE